MNQIEKALSDYLGEMCGMRLKPHALTGLAKAAITAMQPEPQEPVDSAAEITRLTEALRAAEEREKGLREALEPFAKCCEDWISDDEDDEEWAKFRLLIKDYRRASVAMKEQGHDG